MNKTKIDWADSSWNPVTGCLHGCTYCYARNMAHRFSGVGYELCGHDFLGYDLLELDEPYIWTDEYNEPHRIAYPADFKPTLHRYKLDDYKNKSGRTIFVCSMADLFGDFIPDEWIKEVLDACAAAPQHRYLFLTKNPKRYIALAEKGLLPEYDNYWYGTTVTNSADFIPPCRAETLSRLKGLNRFLSVEPLLGEIHGIALQNIHRFGWVIVGAESGNRKDKVTPERSWIEAIAKICVIEKTPVFMKESLRGIMGVDFIQQFPWEVQ